MNILDYTSANDKPVTSLWRRRYLRYVPMAVAILYVVRDLMDRICGQYDPSTLNLPKIIDATLHPMSYVDYYWLSRYEWLSNWENIQFECWLLDFVSALIWGFCVVGLWHLIWTIMHRGSKSSPRTKK